MLELLWIVLIGAVVGAKPGWCTPAGQCWIECCQPHGHFAIPGTRVANKLACSRASNCRGYGGVRNILLLRDGSAGPAHWF